MASANHPERNTEIWPEKGVRDRHVTISIYDLRKLPVPERLELVENLWDIIAADAHLLPLTSQQAEELDRRLADHDANPIAGASWDEVRDKMQKNP